MRKRIIVISLLIASLSPSCVLAQDMAEATAQYKTFVQLVNGAGDRSETFDALYKCYTSLWGVIQKGQRSTDAYNQAIVTLGDILPYMPNAAAWNSNNGNIANAVLFAKAYVDIASLPEMAGKGLTNSKPFAQLSYFAAANLVNNQRFREAIPYLQAYLRSGEETYRKSVFVNLGKACSFVRDVPTGLQAFNEAVANYPTDYDILSSAINFCIDNNEGSSLQRFVDKALALRPTDQTLLNIQGKLYEDDRQYDKALDIYTRLHEVRPKALDVVKHLAIDNYNIGVLNYNKALTSTDKGDAKKLRKEYQEYFSKSIEYLKDVVMAEPSSLKYTQALAVAYNCTGNKDQLAETNKKLASLGGGKVGDDFIPVPISYSNNSVATASVRPAGNVLREQNDLASVQTSQPISSVSNVPVATTAPVSIPPYTEFARQYITDKINKWQEKDDYETLSEYRARVTEDSRKAKIDEVNKEAQKLYIDKYKDYVDFTKLELKPYDAEHGVFLVTSPTLGEMVVPVPRENNEARLFETNWNGMQFKDPKFFVDNDHLSVANLTFVTPTGKEYRYDNSAALNYTETKVDVHFNPIDQTLIAQNSESSNHQTVSQQTVQMGTSDVDSNIPQAAEPNKSTFAVVISNENYDNVAGVPLANNDGRVFAEYCEKALGLPHENIRTYQDATYGTILRAVRDIKDIVKAYDGKVDVIFYYAGHGIPNEVTHDAYILPVDADGTQTEGCYALSRLYQELGYSGARSVVVFLDACFSGAKREDGMLASARGVALKAKKADPMGNMIVFSAASGDETAYPYTEKGHGLFTYYLLKKLQMSGGQASLGELSDYISENVRRQSVVINHKSQTPEVIPSASMAADWQNKKLNQ